MDEWNVCNYNAILGSGWMKERNKFLQLGFQDIRMNECNVSVSKNALLANEWMGEWNVFNSDTTLRSGWMKERNKYL